MAVWLWAGQAHSDAISCPWGGWAAQVCPQGPPIRPLPTTPVPAPQGAVCACSPQPAPVGGPPHGVHGLSQQGGLPAASGLTGEGPDLPRGPVLLGGQDQNPILQVLKERLSVVGATTT